MFEKLQLVFIKLSTKLSRVYHWAYYQLSSDTTNTFRRFATWCEMMNESLRNCLAERNDFSYDRAMTVTTHRDASFSSSRHLSLVEAEESKVQSVGAQALSTKLVTTFSSFSSSSSSSLPPSLSLSLLLHLVLFPLRTLPRVSIALSFLPPTRAPFSNDSQRGLLRHRGNLLALRRIRADCLPLGVSKRAQTFPFPPPPPLPRPGTRAEVRSRFNVTWLASFHICGRFPPRTLFSVHQGNLFPFDTQITSFVSSHTRSLDTKESVKGRWTSSRITKTIILLFLSVFNPSTSTA